jgi:hypothetical protein
MTKWSEYGRKEPCPTIQGFVWKDIPTLHKYVMKIGVIAEIPNISRTQIINVPG